MYSLRHRDAEKRHEEYIQSVKGKAGNENAKVSEVIFINTLNAELLNEELQRQLNEVEERIRACGQRRQERLNGITSSNRQKNRKKVQQMSAIRLSMETQRMERWEKLQQRIEAVQMRRDARLLELAKSKELSSDKKDAEPIEKPLNLPEGTGASSVAPDVEGINPESKDGGGRRKKKKKAKRPNTFPSFVESPGDMFESGIVHY